MRYKITFSYDGSKFNGYQKQKGIDNTIQEKIEDALKYINNGKDTKFTSSGRTDKGVSAYKQVGHADIDVKITEYKLKRALNSLLPDTIHVISTEEVNDDFHARYMVKEKEYQYKLNMGEYNPIERNYVFQYNYDLDINSMKEAIKYFVGKHDFRAFVTDNKEKDNCVREITKASIKEDKGKIIFTFTGDGFLRYQVRNMVGLLIKIGENKISTDSVEKIIESKDRTKASKTAPPEGLYLVAVNYMLNI